MSSLSRKKQIGVFVIIGLIVGLAGGLIALKKLGWKSKAQSPIALLKDEDWKVRRMAALDIAESKDPRAVEPLIERLDDEHWMVRWAVVDALGAIGERRAVDPLINRLKDEHGLVRASSASALGNIGDKRAVEPILPLLTDEFTGPRLATAEALIKLGWSPTTEAEKVNYLIAVGDWAELVKIGQPAVEPLIARLKDMDPRIRTASAATLGRIGDKRAIQPLKDLLNETGERFPGTKRAAQEALKKLKAEEFPSETPKVE